MLSTIKYYFAMTVSSTFIAFLNYIYIDNLIEISNVSRFLSSFFIFIVLMFLYDYMLFQIKKDDSKYSQLSLIFLYFILIIIYYIIKAYFFNGIEDVQDSLTLWLSDLLIGLITILILYSIVDIPIFYIFTIIERKKEKN